MPRKFEGYAPDQMDCNTMVTALGGDFGLLTEIETRYERDQVVVLVRCYSPGGKARGMVWVQAKVSAPLKTAKSLYTMQYSALLDCWHQCDRGVLGVAKTPIEYSWNGRPKTPERSK
jgi:hypothetical protein